MPTLTVGDLMTEDVRTVRPNDEVKVARELLRDRGVHAVPVVDDERGQEPVGIVTSTDLMGDVSDDAPVSVIMSTTIWEVPRGATVGAAASLMRHERVHHLIVRDQNDGHGIISSYDLLAALTD